MALDLYPNQHPEHPGKIGCGMRLTRSRRTTKDPYRSEASRLRRKARREYQKISSFLHKGKRVWSKDAMGFKAWFKCLKEHAA